MSLDPIVLFLSIVVGSVGLALFIYGKKNARLPQLIVGLALMVFPYFTSTAAPLAGIAGLLVVALWWAVRAGW